MPKEQGAPRVLWGMNTKEIRSPGQIVEVVRGAGNIIEVLEASLDELKKGGDGDKAPKGTRLARLTGTAQGLLSAERTALTCETEREARPLRPP